MNNNEKYNRLPKSFFEKERPNIPFEESFDDDYVPFDWVEQIKYEESLGIKVDPKLKKFLGMEENNMCVSEDETEYK